MKSPKNPALNAGVLAIASLVFATGPVQAANPPGYASSAATAAIKLTLATQTVGGLPLNQSAGSGAPAYLDRHLVLNDNTTIPLPVDLGQTPIAVVVNVPVGRTRADGHRVPGGAGYLASGVTVIRTAKIALATTGIVPTNLLLIKATHLTARANAATTLGGVQTNSTAASVGALTISGLLLGGQVIQLHGPLKPGIVFTSPVITISVDKVTSTNSGTGQEQTTVDAVDVEFTHGRVLGSLVSGHIVLGTATAS